MHEAMQEVKILLVKDKPAESTTLDDLCRWHC